MFQRDHRTLFDEAAASYDEARPGYPRELLTELVHRTGLNPETHVLEIGPGTGQLTRLLAQTGCAITAVELGERLAEILEQHFEGNDRINIVRSAFEEWRAGGRRFDLIISAQALHWIDPEVGFPKIHRLLEPSGVLAIVYNLYRQGDDPVHAAVRRAHEEHFPPEDPPGNMQSLRDRVDLVCQSVRSSGRFSEPSIWRHPWNEPYDTQRYLKLLDTFSDHRALNDAAREALYEAVRSAIDAHGGTIHRQLDATLFLSRPI